MIEVNCETDFVAKADKFIQLADKVLAVAVESGAADLETLLATEVDGKPLSEVVIEEGAVLGEKVVVRRISRIEGATVDAYLHKTSKDLPAQVGVLFAVDGEGEARCHRSPRRRRSRRRHGSELPHPRGRSGRARRVRAPHRRGNGQGRGQARSRA